MWSVNSTSSFLDAVNTSCGGVGHPTAISSSPTMSGGGVRHISVAGQAVITASYAVGVAGNAAALAILSRSETARNRKQTLMLRCLAWNDLIALLGMLVQMHLTLYPPSSLYRYPPVNLQPTPSPEVADASIPIFPPTPADSAAENPWEWDPSEESLAGWREGGQEVEMARPPAPHPSADLLSRKGEERQSLQPGSSSHPSGVGSGASQPSAKDPPSTGRGLPSMATAHFLCVLRVVWRLFGLGSGCIAIVMAVERWLALTRPFLYQKQVTYNLIKRSIFSLWAAVLVLVFMPFIGFGVYFQPQTHTCVRYKMATLPKDIAYAYVFFTFGTLLCICIVCCNLAVIRVLCRVGIKGHSVVRRISPSSNHSRFGHHHLLVNLSSATHEELSFARLMAVLCIVFVVCWMPQMISILISQLAPTSKGGRIFSRIADVLMALHFTLDPYIYVLLRSQRRETCSRAILKMLCRRWRSEEHQPPSTPTGEGTASPLVPIVTPDGLSAVKKYGRPPTKTRISTSSIVPVVQEVSSEGLGESEGLRTSDVV
ncbi:prostacyclin receptor [Hetaerina americana]|uniref:prostacyclin receptor n=1 Tax=Hetaerina americana TaxID=62018 RepID=UPI003A7F60C1